MKKRLVLGVACAALVAGSAWAGHRIYETNDAVDFLDKIGGNVSSDYVPGLGPSRKAALVTYVPGQQRNKLPSDVVRTAIDKIGTAFHRLGRLSVSHAELNADDTLYAIEKTQFTEFVGQDSEFDERCLEAILQHQRLVLLAVSASDVTAVEIMRLKNIKSLVYLQLWNAPYTNDEIAVIEQELPGVECKFIRASGY